MISARKIRGRKEGSVEITGADLKSVEKDAAARRTTSTEIFRLAVGLLKVADGDQRANNRLVAATATGRALTEYVLPPIPEQKRRRNASAPASQL